MRYLTLNVVLDLYRQVMEQSGGLTAFAMCSRIGSAIISSRGTYKAGDMFRLLYAAAWARSLRR